MLPKRKEHTVMTFVHESSSTFGVEIFSERSRRKHCFHEKRCRISLTSTIELNALETCSIEAERGRPEQQLTERFSVY